MRILFSACVGRLPEIAKDSENEANVRFPSASFAST